MAELLNIEDGLQAAVFEALASSADVRQHVAQRVFDDVPAQHIKPGDSSLFPYVQIGDDEILDDSNGCGVAFECFVTVHVWSREPGKPQAKLIGAAVRAALDTPLSVGGFVCRGAESHAQSARYFRDPDGLTTHGVLTFRYVFDVAE